MDSSNSRPDEGKSASFLSARRWEFVHTLLASLEEAVVACDADGVLVLFNPAAERLHGLPAQPLGAEQWSTYYDLFRADGTTRLPADEIPLRRALRGEVVRNVEMVIAPRAERRHRVLCNGSAIVGPDGEQLGAVVVMHDVTELLEAQVHSRETRAFLDSIVENIPNMIFVKEAEGLRFVLFNRAGEALLGASRDDLIGKNDYDFFPQNQADFFTSKDRAVLSGTTVLDIPEEQIATPSGERTLHTRKIPIRGEDGAARFLLGISEDITERHLASQNALQLQLEQAKVAEAQSTSARVAAILESITDGFFAVDREWRFTYLNREAELTLQQKREDVLGKRLWDLYPELADTVFGREYLAAMRERRSITFEAYYAPLQRQLEVRAFPSDDGLSVYFRDITERFQAERRNRLLSEASKELASSSDYEASLRRFSGIALPELGDFGFFDLVDKNGEGTSRVAREKVASAREREFDDVITETLRSKTPAILPRPNGNSVMCVPILFGDRCLGALTFVYAESGRTHSDADLAIGVELAERAAIAINNATLYRELNEAVRARDEFLSIASHELKTPLTTMKLQLQVRLRRLAAKDLTRFTPEGLARMLNDEHRQIQRLTHLIDDMLDISRIHGGKLSLVPESLELCALVQEVVTRLSENIADQGVEFRLDLDPPVVGEWDRFRIDQVITNLITNALKYGAREPIVVSVALSSGGALLQIRDEGIGIPLHDQSRIFQRFERAIGASSVSGLGLGLYICKHIVDAHGGSISVESTPGKGSLFSVWLPLHGVASSTDP